VTRGVIYSENSDYFGRLQSVFATASNGAIARDENLRQTKKPRPRFADCLFYLTDSDLLSMFIFKQTSYFWELPKKGWSGLVKLV
jgi:hypothetical protein